MRVLFVLMHNQYVRMEQLAASCHLVNMDAVHIQMYVEHIVQFSLVAARWCLNGNCCCNANLMNAVFIRL